MDRGAKCTLLRGNSERFLGSEASIDGYGVQSVRVKAVQLSLDIGHLSPPATMSALFMYPPFLSISWVLMDSRDFGYT